MKKIHGRSAASPQLELAISLYLRKSNRAETWARSTAGHECSTSSAVNFLEKTVVAQHMKSDSPLNSGKGSGHLPAAHAATRHSTRRHF
jgi:hypothetical protein